MDEVNKDQMEHGEEWFDDDEVQFIQVAVADKKVPRCILCVDLDCFFAQVLLQTRPDLVGKPVGIKQKYIIVTCTYEARALGITKLMLIEDALKIKPDLDILDGSDLTPFREAGKRFFQVTRATLGTQVPLERKGFDEIYADITEPAKALLEEQRFNRLAEHLASFKGHTFPESQSYPKGDVSISMLLSAGSEIAQELRRELKTRLGFRSCAGVSTSKFAAKLASNMHKPDDQTTFLTGSKAALEYFHGLHLRSLPGFGYATRRLFEQNGLGEDIKTCKDLLEKISRNELIGILNGDTDFADTLIGLANGEDLRPVESMDVFTKQLSREETRLPHPTVLKALRERVEELSELVFELMETRFDEAFEWPTTVKLIIKFRSESGKRSKSRSLGRTTVSDEPTLRRIALELLNEFNLPSAFVASHVNLCVTDFQPLVTQVVNAKSKTQSSTSSKRNLDSYFGASSPTKKKKMQVNSSEDEEEGDLYI